MSSADYRCLEGSYLLAGDYSYIYKIWSTKLYCLFERSHFPQWIWTRILWSHMLSLAPRRALFRTHSAPWCSRLRTFSPQYQRGTSDWEQQKHVREVEPLLATADCCHRNKSSLRRTAIWFPSWQRPTTQKDGTESTGIHCWSSLHRDLSCAGKPPLELAGSADASRRGRCSWAGWRPLSVEPFCLLHKGNWARLATVLLGMTSVSKSFSIKFRQ